MDARGSNPGWRGGHGRAGCRARRGRLGAARSAGFEWPLLLGGSHRVWGALRPPVLPSVLCHLSSTAFRSHRPLLQVMVAGSPPQGIPGPGIRQQVTVCPLPGPGLACGERGLGRASCVERPGQRCHRASPLLREAAARFQALNSGRLMPVVRWSRAAGSFLCL